MPQPSLDLLTFHACLCFARRVLEQKGYKVSQICPNPESIPWRKDAGWAYPYRCRSPAPAPLFIQAGQSGWDFGDRFHITVPKNLSNPSANLMIGSAGALSWRPDKRAKWDPMKPPAELRLAGLPKHSPELYIPFVRALEQAGICCMVPAETRQIMAIEDEFYQEVELGIQADCAMVDAVRKAEFDHEWKPLAEMLG